MQGPVPPLRREPESGKLQLREHYDRSALGRAGRHSQEAGTLNDIVEPTKGLRCQIQNGGTRSRVPRSAAPMTISPPGRPRSVRIATNENCRIGYARSVATTKTVK